MEHAACSSVFVYAWEAAIEPDLARGGGDGSVKVTAAYTVYACRCAGPVPRVCAGSRVCAEKRAKKSQGVGTHHVYLYII